MGKLQSANLPAKPSLFGMSSSTTERVSDTNSFFTGSLFVLCNVVVQLGGLLIQFGLVRVALSCLDIQGNNLQLQLQNLVLDLSTLQSRSLLVVCGGSNSFIEAASTDFGCFSYFTLILQGLKIFFRDSCRVGDLDPRSDYRTEQKRGG
jgi:hypothetical protein